MIDTNTFIHSFNSYFIKFYYL